MPDREQIKELVARAAEVREHAYAPYSQYAVGAALRAGSGAIFAGVNTENASYPVTMCAERSAVFQAIAHGERRVTAIAVVSENGGSPCGACLQVLSEFADDTLVILALPDGEITTQLKLGELLPHAFGPGDLPKRG